MIKILFSLMLILVACQAQYKVGTTPTNPPFGNQVNGKFVGFDYDFFAAVAAKGKFTYELEKFLWLDMFDQVKNKKVDFALSGITINADRQKTYDFSVPYFVSTHKILAKKGTNIKNAQGLKGKKVAVITGTTGEAAVQKILGAKNANIKGFTASDDAINALKSGAVDAYVNDNGILEYFAKENAGYVVIADNKAFTKEFYGLMFPKGSALRAKINPFITAVLNGGYAKIYKDWFGSNPDTVNLLIKAGKVADPYSVL